MVCIDMWKERMRLFELTNALSRKSEMIDEYFRIYTGSGYAYRKKLDEEAAQMAKKMKENGGIIFVEGLPSEEVEEKVYKISSDCVTIIKE